MRKKAKKEYFMNQLSLNKDNTKGTWKVMVYWEKKETTPNSLLIQRENMNDETIVNNRFAEFFQVLAKMYKQRG